MFSTSNMLLGSLLGCLIVFWRYECFLAEPQGGPKAEFGDPPVVAHSGKSVISRNLAFWQRFHQGCSGRPGVWEWCKHYGGGVCGLYDLVVSVVASVELFLGARFGDSPIVAHSENAVLGVFEAFWATTY